MNKTINTLLVNSKLNTLLNKANSSFIVTKAPLKMINFNGVFLVESG